MAVFADYSPTGIADFLLTNKTLIHFTFSTRGFLLEDRH
jgi:hypothetical protein